MFRHLVAGMNLFWGFPIRRRHCVELLVEDGKLGHARGHAG